LQYFPGFFLKVGFFQKKQDTRAILLKTALVHVSCIQNTQIRGETTTKVFGKVDTFWMYQGVGAIESNDMAYSVVITIGISHTYIHIVAIFEGYFYK
jgi:hypothetical protein